MIFMGPVHVFIRSTGGAYFARCAKSQASSTSAPVYAAERAAAKAFACPTEEVLLKAAPGGAFYYAIRSSVPVEGYASCGEISRAEADAREAAWKASRQ